MAAGLLTPLLDALEPDALPISYPASVSRSQALAMAKAAPSNQDVVDACKSAYGAHMDAVDSVTLGGINSAQSPNLQGDIAAMQQYNWRSRIAAPNLVTPIYESQTMAGPREAVAHDGAFATWFLGITANVDVFVGGFGGVGVGLPFPFKTGMTPLWMAYGGLRIALNIDVAVNLSTGLFLEPPSEVAGDFVGLDVSGEPVYEGPSVGFGIHLSTDLQKIRGFSVSVGVELGLLPVTAAVVFGTIATT